MLLMFTLGNISRLINCHNFYHMLSSFVMLLVENVSANYEI